MYCSSILRKLKNKNNDNKAKTRNKTHHPQQQQNTVLYEHYHTPKRKHFCRIPVNIAINAHTYIYLIQNSRLFPASYVIMFMCAVWVPSCCMSWWDLFVLVVVCLKILLIIIIRRRRRRRRRKRRRRRRRRRNSHKALFSNQS